MKGLGDYMDAKEKAVECCVCFEKITGWSIVICQSCGNKSFCASCAAKIQECPLCRANAALPPAKILVHIHFINGAKYKLIVSPHDTVQFVAAELDRLHKEGSVTLIYGGRALSLDATLSNRGITHGSTIHGIHNMRGD